MTTTGHPAQPALRRDAARNRARIMEAARGIARDGKALQLNAVALAADVGVGTVYRHFATPEALLAALAVDQFAILIGQAEEAIAAPDAREALRTFLKTAVTAYAHDDAFAASAINPSPATPDVQRLRHELQEHVRRLLARAAADEALQPSLDAADMMLLLCGIGFAVRHAPNRDDPDLPERYLNALLDGAVVPRQP